MFISLDLETTGIDPKKDKIIEFGAIKFDLNGNSQNLQFLINPGVTLPQIITHITGLKDSDLADAPSFEEKKEEIINFIGNHPIVGHNIGFDMAFLRNNGLEINNPEYDTVTMTSALLPHLPSYSLEIISGILDLKHEEKHRALDDSVAAMELFLALINKFKELDPDLTKEIKEILKKSNWPLAAVLIDQTPTQKKLEKIHKKTIDENQQSLFSKQEDYSQIIKAKEKTLFEITPPYNKLVTGLINQENKDTLISVPYKLFREIYREIPENIAQLDDFENYISVKRLMEFSKKPKLEPHEATTIIKCLIWLKETKTGLLSEVSFFGREKSVLPLINADPEFTDVKKEPFILKATDSDKSSATICTHQYLLNNSVSDHKKIILINFESFTKTVHFELSSAISMQSTLNILEELKINHPEDKEIENLISKTMILFGLYGIIFDNYNDDSNFAARSSITENIRSLKIWKDLISALANITEISEALEKTERSDPLFKKWSEFLKLLKEIIENPTKEDEQVFIEKDYEENMRIRRNKLNISKNITEILGKLSPYILITETVDINDKGNFVKKIWGLPKDIKVEKNPQSSPRILLAKNCPENEIDNKHTVLNFLTREISTKKGKIAFVLPHNQMEFFTLKLKQNLPKNILVLSHITGSISKLNEQFRSWKKDVVILMTSGVWDNFESTKEIETLFVHKIPFDSPMNPYIASISAEFQNGFMEFTVPHAIMNLKKVLNRLSPQRKAIILDSRIINKDYGKLFTDSLGEVETFSIGA